MSDGAEAELKISGKDGVETRVPINNTPFVVGRAGTDLNLDDTSVSRRHCEYVKVGDMWVIRDLGSSNGTFVDGEKVVECFLRGGEQVRIGNTEMVFVLYKRGRGTSNLMEDTALWSIVELSVGAGEQKKWMTRFLETLLSRYQGDRGFIVDYEQVTGTVSNVASVSMEAPPDVLELRAPFSKSIVEQVINDKKAVITHDAIVDPRFREAVSVAQFEIKSVICAPARWQGTPVGAVYLERGTGKQPFTDADSQELQDLADLFGIARMAWRGHLIASKNEWEKEWLMRTFPEAQVNALLTQGGMSSIRRRAKEICVIALRFFRTDQLLKGGNEEAWRSISQFISQVNDTVMRAGGALVGHQMFQFGDFDDGKGDFHLEAVRASQEIQRMGRGLVKRMNREMKVTFALGAGVVTGESLIGFFGAGQRVEYMALGETGNLACGLAAHAQDGEVLIDQPTYNKVRLFCNTHRVAPVTLAGFERQVQPYRLVPY
jgi:adenylate cyclase